jgi:[acyl-carrier-protein] S-malonyltransferase
VTAAAPATDGRPAPARTAWLFPGQGGTLAGALRVTPGPVARLLARAGEALGVDLPRLVATGDPRLARTEVAQPALVAVCLGIARELEARDGGPDVVAGHSLGELTAAAFAGYFSDEEAIELAVERGRAMAACARARPGAMAAVRTEDPAEVDRWLARGRARGEAVLAAHNAPTQWVLSGDRGALAAIAETTALTFLATDGAWHSPRMAPAQERWGARLRAARLDPPSRTLILNCGRAAAPGEDLAALLAGQLTRPIDWVASLRTLQELGVARIVALGPAKALRGLCRETLGTDVPVALVTGEPTP